MKMYRILFPLFLLPACLCAQEAETARRWEEVACPQALPQADRLLRFTPKEVDAGTLSEDDAPSHYTFTCRNVSQERVVLSRVDTSCGCTGATVARPALEPGEETDITVTFNPFGHPGKMLSRVLVYAEAFPEKPVAVLTLCGEVTPSAALWKDYRYAMGALRVRRKRVDFGRVLAGQKRVERIACANSGETPLRVSALKLSLPQWLSVGTEPAELAPSQEGELVLTIDGDRLPTDGSKRIDLKVLLEGISARPSERTLQVSVETE